MATDPASVIAAASAARDVNSTWSDVGSLAVLVGVSLEFVDLGIIKQRLGLYEHPNLTEALSVFGIILAVVGLAVEYGTGLNIHKQTEIIEITLNREAGKALGSASDAGTVAQSAVAKAGAAASEAEDTEKTLATMKAQERALNASIQIERDNIRKADAEIKQLTDVTGLRHFDNETIAAIVMSARFFKGQKFSIQGTNSFSEVRLERQIYDALAEAGWVYQGDYSKAFHIPDQPGVQLWSGEGAASIFSCGMIASTMRGSTEGNLIDCTHTHQLPDGLVLVVIGSRP